MNENLKLIIAELKNAELQEDGTIKVIVSYDYAEGTVNYGDFRCFCDYAEGTVNYSDFRCFCDELIRKIVKI